MKLSSIFLGSLAATTALSAAVTQDDTALINRNAAPEADASFEHPEILTLEKRKGGGGGRGGGGGSSSGGGRSGGSSSSGSSNSGSRSGSSNVGGSTSGGSGARPITGASGGRAPVYAGGATVPYSAGRRVGSITPFLLGGAALGALVFLPALALAGAGAYFYNLPNDVTYYNATSNMNETHPAKCFCQQYLECGCSDNTDSAYVSSIIGNGSAAALNQTGSALAPNGTLFINGTLANGTTAATSGAESVKRRMLEYTGWWMSAAVVSAIVLMN